MGHISSRLIQRAWLLAGDTDSSSSDLEAIPTRRGLHFGDEASPSGSEFATPRASVGGGRADSFISLDEGNFGEPSIFVPGHAVSRGPIQLQGPTFGVSIEAIGLLKVELACINNDHHVC